MLLHTDASTHAWIPGLAGQQDLIAVLDDATRAASSAHFVPEESTRTMLAALRAVIETQGLFCALSVDRPSHCLTTRTGPSPHRPQQAAGLTQIERALTQLGIDVIPAHSPQARGRMERLWETWQGRLPQDLRLAGLTTVPAANAFLATPWMPFHTQTWTVPASEEGMACVPYTGGQLDRILALEPERVVGLDTCVAFGTRRVHIPKAAWRSRFATCRVTVSEHLDDPLSIGHGPHPLGRYDADGHLRIERAGRPGTAASPSVLPAPPGGMPCLERGQGHLTNRTDHLLSQPDILTCY